MGHLSMLLVFQMASTCIWLLLFKYLVLGLLPIYPARVASGPIKQFAPHDTNRKG